MELGFPLRQAQFLTHVLVFSGVFLERQYRAFTGVAHGQRTHDFLAKLIDRGYATAITPGAVHRGKLFHVQYKPLYEAIGEPDNRHRRAASLGRFVERLMLLDAVLADTRRSWLGTEHDKLAYFRAAIDMELPNDFYPHVTYGHGADTTTRFFPEKFPIGVPRAGHRRHVFVYLATREVPMDFRVFLLRHADLLPRVDEWTIRVLVPRRLKKAVALYRYAVRDAFMMPVTPHDVEELDWYFRGLEVMWSAPLATRDSTSRRRQEVRRRAVRRPLSRVAASGVARLLGGSVNPRPRPTATRRRPHRIRRTPAPIPAAHATHRHRLGG